MRNINPRTAPRAAPFAAAVLAATVCQGVIYLFARADIGLVAACASMLAIAAIVVGGLAYGRSESERRLVSVGPAPAMPPRPPRAYPTARERA